MTIFSFPSLFLSLFSRRRISIRSLSYRGVEEERREITSRRKRWKQFHPRNVPARLLVTIIARLRPSRANARRRPSRNSIGGYRSGVSLDQTPFTLPNCRRWGSSLVLVVVVVVVSRFIGLACLSVCPLLAGRPARGFRRRDKLRS